MFFKKITLKALLLLVFYLFIAFPVKAQVDPQIYFFYGQGCSHCQKVEDYFKDQNILEQYPVIEKDIYQDRNSALLFNALMEKFDVPQTQRGVPTVVMGDKFFIGDQPIINNFKLEADKFLLKSVIQSSSQEDLLKVPKTNDSLTWLLVVSASLVDAINPCAFAVLIILMTTILSAGKPLTALKTGLAFASSVFISYFLMGLGLYKTLQLTNLSGLFTKIIGWLAIFLGLFNLKDYFWYGKGFLMEVPLSWRPKMKSFINSIVSPTGAFFIGFVISLFLLPCTSGPYIVILGMLADKTTQAKAISYLLAYNLVFISPMILLTLAVYKGLSPKKIEILRQKHLKNLHLIAGLILFFVGLALLQSWL